MQCFMVNGDVTMGVQCKQKLCERSCRAQIEPLYFQWKSWTRQPNEKVAVSACLHGPAGQLGSWFASMYSTRTITHRMCLAGYETPVNQRDVRSREPGSVHCMRFVSSLRDNFPQDTLPTRAAFQRFEGS